MASTTFTNGTTIASSWLNDVNSITYGLGQSTGSALVTFLQAGTGATARTVQAKLRDIISVKDFGAIGDGATDDTTAIQAALTYTVQNNLKLFFPAGIYLISTGLTMTGVSASTYGKLVQLEGVGGQVDGTPGATILKWNGSSNSGNTLIKVSGLAKLVCKGIAFFGNSKVGKVFWATQAAGTYSPQGWGFEDCTFEVPLSGGYGFYIDTTTNMPRFNFSRCFFQAGVGSTGFYSSNQNSVSHFFFACQFGPNDYGININGGAFRAVACEFAQNALADVYLQIHGPVEMYGCWSEQSRQFILSDFRTQYSPLTLVGCKASSFPWSYWKQGPEGSRTQPTNNSTQWNVIVWDGNRGALNLVGCNFADPFNGAVTGAIAPTTASTILVDCPNGSGTFPKIFNFIGSFSQNGVDSFTEQFATRLGGTAIAPRFPTRKKYTNYGSLGAGSYSLPPEDATTSEITLTGNHAYTIPTANSNAGDKCKVIVNQGGGGGFTTTFTNTKIVGGSFVPTGTAGAKSYIMFEFDGTNWIEDSRGLNLS